MSDRTILTRRATIRSGLAAVGFAATGSRPVRGTRASRPTQTGGSWPQVHGDGSNTGHVPADTGPVRAVETEWSADVADDLYSAVVRDGRVYVGSLDGNSSVTAFDAETGERLWQQPLDIGTRTAPVVAGEVVIVVTEDGRMYGLDAASGDTRWSHSDWDLSRDESVKFAPTVGDGVVYVPVPNESVSGSIHAVDATDGTRVWRYGTEYWHPNATPAVADGTVYAGFDDRVVALDVNDGTERWHYDTAGRVTTPVLSDGAVFVGANGNVYRLAAGDGSLTWRNTQGFQTPSPPAVDGERVYYDEGLRVAALDIADGSFLWEYSAVGGSGSSPVVTGRAVYYWEWEDNVLHGLDPASGEALWTLDLGGQNDRIDVHGTPHPAVVDGTIYLGNLDGTLYAVGGEGPAGPTSTRTRTPTRARTAVETPDAPDQTSRPPGRGTSPTGSGTTPPGTDLTPGGQRGGTDCLLPGLLLALTVTGYGALTAYRRTQSDSEEDRDW